MRKEDKRQLPPKLKLKLPQGLHLERKPNEYVLYASYPVVDKNHHQKGTMTDLMGVFSSDSRPEEIEEYARNAVKELAKRLEHSHPSKGNAEEVKRW